MDWDSRAWEILQLGFSQPDGLGGVGGSGRWGVREKGEGHLRTLLSSFWYWGIFFSIWDRSRMVVCGEESTLSLDLREPCEAGGHMTGQWPLKTPQGSTQGHKCCLGGGGSHLQS